MFASQAWIPRGHFHLGWDVYEEGIQQNAQVATARDHTLQDNRRITFHRGPACDRRFSSASIFEPTRDRVHSLERKTTCVDSHKPCRFQSSNSRYKVASWSNHPVRGNEIGAIRRKVFLQDSWPYKVAIWAEDTNRGVHLDAGGGILRIGNVGKGYPWEGRSDGTRDRLPTPRHSSN